MTSRPDVSSSLLCFNFSRAKVVFPTVATGIVTRRHCSDLCGVPISTNYFQRPRPNHMQAKEFYRFTEKETLP